MHSALPHPRIPLLLIPLVLLLLAACSSPPPATGGGATRTGTVNVPEGSTVPAVLGAAIVMADYGALGTTSTVTEVYENLYVGPLVPIRSDGTV